MTAPMLGVCYYPEHWLQSHWADDAARMAALGLSWVRIGEFAWSRLEPYEGVYNWSWLDAAIDTLGKADLKIVLGTPTATPPRWMVDKYPDMLAYDEQGRPRKFGSRRHYCFSHEGYKDECRKICDELGKRFGGNPYIKGWQIDNEYGCHDTTVSYSPAAKFAFQTWLKIKYNNVEALNEAWGNVFWSMEYARFEDIDLPNLTVTEPNPSHVMDFRRFSSNQVVRFNRLQCDVLRQYTDQPLIHNYMGRITDFDHFAVGDDLEIASWDSYPLGFLEDRSEQSDAWKVRFTRQGDPDFQAFHHDLYRAVGKGRWWVMEQQPGPVNWAPFNPAPLPGMVRLWTWEAIAHGAEVVSYFRWRQAPFAQEQMHAGLLRPDNKPATGFAEIESIDRELKQLSLETHKLADVAIVFDYPSNWAWEVQPQGQSFTYFDLIFDYYRALRRAGLSVDILPSSTVDFSDRKLVIIPGLFTWNENLKAAIDKFEGNVLIGPRSGSKTPDFQIPNTLPPVFPKSIKVTSVETLCASESVELKSGGSFHSWREFTETSAKPIIETNDDYSALIQDGKLFYVCGWPDADGMTEILTSVGIEVKILPEGLRVRDFGYYRLYMNYNKHAVTYEDMELPPAGIRLIETSSKTILIES